jgi:hypothetical protein
MSIVEGRRASDAALRCILRRILRRVLLAAAFRANAPHRQG